MLKKEFNRNQLKYIAIIAMIIDHIGYFFIPITNPIGFLSRFIGRLTAPIMCYFLAEGFFYTSSKLKYGIRLFIFSIISQIAFYCAVRTMKFNMIFNLFICFLMLLSYEKIENKFVKWTVILFLIYLSYFCDWGIIAPLYVLFFYIFRNKKGKQINSFYIITTLLIIKDIIYCVIMGLYWYSRLWKLGLFLFIPVICKYNGENGKNNKFNKWFFYIFYPLQFFIFALIKEFI